ncbi:HAD family hydrolase [Massilia sp. PAMC28688]|uniref:HAD family hydrolase n=1 Tax=Massilia sp. PAMC28688 TaxID=2861283 RepID=UPI001C62E659|nr:HAD family hydrolase [Massilia sp. PAMC28688]QYF92031.1 HAD family hydrolase [Massilia sp. PAMC28688]
MAEKLQANALDSSWLPSHQNVKVLSLDCFDTLLWRKVSAPTDVFFSLARSEVFTRMGLSAPLRAKAEVAARRISWINFQTAEVSLEQIYRQAVPHASEAELAELAAAELACEIAHCFVYQPVHDLIVQAKTRGMKVIVVSDTYLSEQQLRTLLFSCMPALEGLIDAVYVSSAHLLSKGDGIFRKILPQLKVKPEQVLHLGDNKDADLLSPLRFGMQAAHFVHHHEDTRRILSARLQVAAQLLPELHHREPVPNYYQAPVASSRQPDQLSTFGYVSLGPILYAFADFVLREAARRGAGGQAVRIGFLLRDGFLPSKACATLAGAPVGTELNISRFTAIAASLATRESVVSLLSKTLNRDNLDVLTRQLLLPGALADRILRQAAKADLPEREFSRLVLQQEALNTIFAQSRAFRRRLVTHVRKVTGVQPGDTLMFVDLGYSGTAQTLLKEVFKQDLDVELTGCYLIADEVMPHQSDRKGLIDAATMDGRIVQALTGNYIAGFEMLCTQDAPSTVNYTEDGDPVFSSTALGGAQQSAVTRIQQACLQFIADMRDTPAAHKPRPEPRQMAQGAAIDLARLLYFPTPMELDCLNSFQFDFNLGTDKTMALFDADAGLRAMRTQGFGYMNAGLDDMRTNYTMELRALDLSLSVMLFSQNRFGFDMQPASASYRQEKLQVMVANASEHTMQELVATATYDGFFSLIVPLSPSFNVGVMMGQNYAWVQIDSVQLITDNNLTRGTDMEPGDAVLFDQMQHADNGLFQVDAGGLVYLPGKFTYGPKMMCRIIFRPIAYVARTS